MTITRAQAGKQTKLSPKKRKKVSKVMSEFKKGTLKSGASGKKVTNPDQAVAIAHSKANAMKKGGTVKDACYRKVKKQYKVFPSAYASGAIAKCRKAKAKGKK